MLQTYKQIYITQTIKDHKMINKLIRNVKLTRQQQNNYSPQALNTQMINNFQNTNNQIFQKNKNRQKILLTERIKQKSPQYNNLNEIQKISQFYQMEKLFNKKFLNKKSNSLTKQHKKLILNPNVLASQKIIFPLMTQNLNHKLSQIQKIMKTQVKNQFQTNKKKKTNKTHFILQNQFQLYATRRDILKQKNLIVDEIKKDIIQQRAQKQKQRKLKKMLFQENMSQGKQSQLINPQILIPQQLQPEIIQDQVSLNNFFPLKKDKQFQNRYQQTILKTKSLNPFKNGIPQILMSIPKISAYQEIHKQYLVVEKMAQKSVRNFKIQQTKSNELFNKNLNSLAQFDHILSSTVKNHVDMTKTSTSFRGQSLSKPISWVIQQCDTIRKKSFKIKKHKSMKKFNSVKKDEFKYSENKNNQQMVK